MTTWLRLHGTLFLAAFSIAPVPVVAQDLFYAREFLMTRQFRMGRDIWPGYAGPPMAVHSRGIYAAAAFQVGGFNIQAGGFEFQGAIRRYDLAGNELWTRQILPNVFPASIAVDNAGGAYLAGFVGLGSSEMFLRRYDEDGNEVWSRQGRLPAGGSYIPAGMDADASGVYVAAWNGYSQGLIRKYSPAGVELWTQLLDVRSLRGFSLEASAFYVAGLGESGAFIRKYDLTGAVLWTRQLRSPESEVSIFGALASDSDGIYLGGVSYLRRGEGEAYLTETGRGLLRRLDTNGNELWTREIGTMSPAAITAVSIDSSGVHVAGSAGRALPGQCRAGGQDVFVAHYDAAGAEQWTRQFGTAGYDEPGNLAVDGTGVYLSGAIRGGPAHGSLFIAKLPKAPVAAASGRPEITRECVVNAAGYTGGGVAPGEIVTVFGSGIGPGVLARLQVGEDGSLATTLADTRILFNGMAAPLLYVSATQSGAIVPYAIASATTVNVEVEYRGVRSTVLTLPVANSRPGIFSVDGSGAGQGAIVNEDGSLNSPDNPAPRGSTVALYATGEGLTDPSVANGLVLTTVLPKPTLPVAVSFDNPIEEGTLEEATVTYAGGVRGGVAGLLQVNVLIPSWVRPGDAVPVYLRIGGQTADTGAKMAIR
jgi:uncharacterized protein (TIGR03437 family)